MCVCRQCPIHYCGRLSEFRTGLYRRRPRKAPLPGKKILCTISQDGVNIPSVTPEEIISYDVYSSEGDCIATFTSEMDFVSFLYGISGTFEIRIHIEGSIPRFRFLMTANPHRPRRQKVISETWLAEGFLQL